MRDVLDSVAAQISERVSNPVFLPFIISWIVINHKAFLYLISQNTVSTKLEALGEHFEWQSTVLNGYTLGLIYPLAFALAFVVFYPLANRHIMIYWRSQARKAKADYVRHLDLNPLSREEAREIRREAERKVSESESELEKKSRQLTLSVKKVAELEEEIETTESKYDDVTATLNKERTGHQEANTAWNEERRITDEKVAKLRNELERQREINNREKKAWMKGAEKDVKKAMFQELSNAANTAWSEIREHFPNSQLEETAIFYDRILDLIDSKTKVSINEIELLVPTGHSTKPYNFALAKADEIQKLLSDLSSNKKLQEWHKASLSLTEKLKRINEKFPENKFESPE